MKNILLFFFMLLTVSMLQAQEKRLALVIGNAAYQNGGALRNPVNDANLMATTLQELGFEVIKKTNADLRTMQLATADFTNRIVNYDVALFYYAGHGIQVEGVNYLIPVDAKLEEKVMCKFEAFDVKFINEAFAQNQSNVNIMILDACRDNPFRSWMRSSASRGFVSLSNQPAGTIIAFATREGETAADGTGNNGLYTEKLVQELKVAQNITEVFQNTRTKVLSASGSTQCPQEWNMLTGNFVLAPTGAGNNSYIPPTAQVGNATNVGGNTTNSPSIGAAEVLIGSLKLTTEISGTLYIDGIESGSVNANTMVPVNNLSIGNHRIEIRGNENWQQNVTILANQSAALTAKTTLRYGSIALTSEIAGTLYLDGKSLGTIAAGTRTPINNVTTGSHNLEIRGTETWQQSITVNENLSTTVEAKRRTPIVNPNNQTAAAEVSGPNGMVFRRIEGGTFQMGSTTGDSDEQPVHSVTLSTYYMSKYEVTQAQWKAVMGSNPSSFSGCDKCPVENVSWDDIQTFIQKLNAQTGQTYRLPTEAEWEYACRAGTTTPFNTGNNLTTSQANYHGDYPYNGNPKGEYRVKTTPVGTFAPNAWGLYDMHGNVREWCSDWYGTYPSGSQTNPTGAATGSRRVFRGGSWYSFAQYCRSAYRYYSAPDNRDYYLGFRLVLAP